MTVREPPEEGAGAGDQALERAHDTEWQAVQLLGRPLDRRIELAVADVLLAGQAALERRGLGGEVVVGHPWMPLAAIAWRSRRLALAATSRSTATANLVVVAGGSLVIEQEPPRPRVVANAPPSEARFRSGVPPQHRIAPSETRPQTPASVRAKRASEDAESGRTSLVRSGCLARLGGDHRIQAQSSSSLSESARERGSRPSGWPVPGQRLTRFRSESSARPTKCGSRRRRPISISVPSMLTGLSPGGAVGLRMDHSRLRGR